MNQGCKLEKITWKVLIKVLVGIADYLLTDDKQKSKNHLSQI